MIEEIKKSIIVKSNRLVTARYKLSLTEQRLLLLLISMINKDDQAFKPYSLKVKDISICLDIKGKFLYEKLQDVTEKILSRVLKIENEKEGTFTQLHWISKATYYRRRGYVEFTLDPDLKEHLLQLKEKFTKYSLQSVLRFNSIYSIRIYELLKQFQNIGVRTFTLLELREIFSIEPNEYRFYGDFKRKVILTAQKELYNNKDSDVCFEFEEQKKGRKVESLKFVIYKKVVQRKLPFSEIHSPVDDSMIVDTLKKYKLSKSQILEILSYPSKRIIENIKYTEQYKGPIDNLTAFIYSAIKKDYASTMSTSTKKNLLPPPRKSHNQKNCPECEKPLMIRKGRKIEGKKVDDFFYCKSCKINFYRHRFPSLYV